MDILRLNFVELTFLTLSLLFSIKNASGLDCFQCDSTSERTCAESLPQHNTLAAESCDAIQEAQYCVKMTGVFEGELGTKRFCSSRDWGNYCEWVRRPGDEREYRACVFTCGGNGCNAGDRTTALSHFVLVPMAILTLIFSRTSILIS